MKTFIKNGVSFLALLLIPAIILTAFYVYFDPFQIVKNHSIFNYTPIEPNRDFVSTENFLANRQKYNFNSFIFGSSRSTSFKVNSWAEYLNEYAFPFAYDAAGESLYGIYKKLKFLDKEDTNIENVLILFCRDGFYKTDNHTSRLGIKHPMVSGESWIKFHFVAYKSYFSLNFLLGYYSYMIMGKETIFSTGIIQNKGVTIDNITNQINLSSWDDELMNNPQKYYESRKNIFYFREKERYESNGYINEIHTRMLYEIKEILERNNSNYKIILSPIYDQVKFSATDKALLLEIFEDNLFDFTGKSFITECDTNWYETYHFRPFIADSIMNIVYSHEERLNNWR